MNRSRPVSGTRSRLADPSESFGTKPRATLTVRYSISLRRRDLQRMLSFPANHATLNHAPTPAITSPRSPPNLRFSLNTIGLFELMSPLPGP